MGDTLRKTLNFHSDPGTGWLEVERDLATLCLVEQITPFSYERGERVFLEEDQGKGVFLKAARAAGWTIERADCYSPGSSFVLNLDTHRP